MSTDDEERLTPLGVTVNGQDQPEISSPQHHQLADHHVIARTDLRAGTVKARRPRARAGGAKRSALHGAEHRCSIVVVMAAQRWCDPDRDHPRGSAT